MWNQLLDHYEHRPYPLPEGPWVMRMRWTNVLFAHWPVPVDVIRPLVPPGLEVDTFDGSPWLSIVPVQISAFALRFLPALPRLSDFPQLNARTYVKTGGKPGIWFFSIDTPGFLSVAGARMLFHLPYARSRMTFHHEQSQIVVGNTRNDPSFPPAHLRAVWQPDGEPAPPAKGSLNEWLVERYCLYSAGRDGTLFRGEVHHLPMPLQASCVQITENTMFTAAGIASPLEQPVAHYASNLDVVSWAPGRIS